MHQRIVVAPAQISQNSLQLTQEQYHYLCRVLRLRGGDRFLAMDGQGKTWMAQLEQAPATATLLEPVVSQTELPFSIELVMALPKGSGFDEVVRQATELGVAKIVPVISDRTLLQPSSQKLDRWRRIAQEAAEQSEREIIPVIQPPVPFAEHLQQAENETVPKFLCVTRHPAPHLLSCLISPTPPLPRPSSLLIAIGPEGGWTEAEIESAVSAGYQPVSLGQRILRSLTAPIVALAIVAAAWEGEPDCGDIAKAQD